ncbi:MAG TPA: hypothetical protein VKK31_21405 [Thermoanaerobaculia bacterium]|nr:hypothetical protein [Thermoanaerobaculia bacterium]
MHHGTAFRRAVSGGTLVLVLIGTAAAAAGQVELISKADPIPDTNGHSFPLSISADGRYLVFASDAPNLMAGQVDRNASNDIFVRDRVMGTTTLVTHVTGLPRRAVPDPGLPGVLGAQISADGRFVVFSNSSGSLVPGDGNFRSDVFLYDRAAGTTTLVSHASGDAGSPGDNNSFEARINADGGAVVFKSSARNLVAGQAGPLGDNVFLYRRSSGAITLVSRQAGSAATMGNAMSDTAEISADGRFVAFNSLATDLVPGQADTNARVDVFVFDSSSGTVSLVSRASGSPLQTASGSSRNPRLSDDGRWIAFASDAPNLVPGQVEGGGALDAFLYDRVSGEMRLASHTAASPLAAGGIVSGLSLDLNADGRYVVFVSGARNLVTGQVDTNSRADVFVYDRLTGTSELVSHTRRSRTTATAEPVSASSPGISADGRYVAFQSGATDLVPRQTDRRFDTDVFLHDRFSQTTVLASHAASSATTAASGQFPILSRNGNVVAFVSFALNLAQGQVDPNGFSDVFLYSRGTAEVALASGRHPALPVVTPHGESSAYGISADGRFVLFTSTGAGLVPGQIDPLLLTTDVFLRDRATGKTLLLSHAASSPRTASGAGLSPPALSADGRFAAFESLPDSRPPTAFPFYVHDRTTDTRALVNHVPGSFRVADGFVRDAVFSADGRYLAYNCGSCSLVPGQQAGNGDLGNNNVFLYDRVTRTNTLVSHASGSPVTVGNANSGEPRISADGRFVAFTSGSTDLVAGQSPPDFRFQVFVFDRQTGTNTLVSHTPGSATTGVNVDSQSLAISGNGRWILFRSAADNAVAGQVDGNQAPDLFLHDRVSGQTSLVSHASSSPVTAANGGTESASMSANGRWIAFESLATDLVPGVTDTNGAFDVFLYDRFNGAAVLVSSGSQESRSPRISADGGRIAYLSAGNLVVYDRTTGARTVVGRVRGPEPLPPHTAISLIPWQSANGRQVAFTSNANNLVAGDRNENWDVFVFDDGNP